MFAIHYHTQFNSFLKEFQNYLSGNVDINYIMSRYASIFTIQFHIRTYQDFIPYTTNQSSSIQGYPFIKLLHDNINQPNFIECRNNVSVISVTKNKNSIFSMNNLGIKKDNDFLEYMKNNEVIINAFDSKESHSLTVYCDSNTNSFFVHNTNDPKE